MATDFLASRRAIEARKIETCDGPLGAVGHVPYDERVRSVSKEQFKAPSSVAKVATRALADELDELLKELWELNEDHVGERTREAEVDICHDEEFVWLEVRLIDWSRRFLDVRLEKEKSCLSKDRDPCAQFLRIVENIEKTFSVLTIEETIGYILWDIVQIYSLWHVYTQTYRDSLERLVDFDPLFGDQPRVRVSPQCWEIAYDRNFLDDLLGKFVGRIQKAAPAEELREIRGMGNERIRRELILLASNIQEARPFLIHNFKENKTIIQVSDRFWLAWKWGQRFGIADIVGGDSERDVRQAIYTSETAWWAKIDLWGRLLDPFRPYSLGDNDGRCQTFGLAESLFVLQRFHDRLLQFYCKIDLKAISKEVSERSEPGERYGTASNEQFALSCQELAHPVDDIPLELEAEEDRRKGHGLRVRKLRYKPFVDCLKKWFHCVIEHGKGSEIVIKRPTHTRQCVLRRHGLNPEYSYLDIKRTLKRLRISESEWIARVYGLAGLGRSSELHRNG